jgi:hypothetical protein
LPWDYLDKDLLLAAAEQQERLKPFLQWAGQDSNLRPWD